MKKTLLFLFGLFFTIMTASADGGWADCAVCLTKDGEANYCYLINDAGWTDGDWGVNTEFNAKNFGTPTSLVLNGGKGNAWTDDTPGYNSSSFVLYYRVYKTGTTPGSWSQIALDNLNKRDGYKYIYDKTNAGIDILALVTDLGTYVLEVAMSKNQFYAGGNWNSMIPGGQGIPYDPSTGGYKATFTKSASIATPTVTGISPSSGTTAGGASVVITGTNFTGVTAVKFGSVNATNFTVNSNTQITATSPAGAAGTVDVTVTTAGGTSATSGSDKFTTLAAAPSIAYGVNLVVNGDAETGNLTGWTAGGTDAAYFVNDVTTPYGDSAEAGHNRVFDFYGPARKNQEATLSQTIDITALQSQISSGLVSATSSGQIYGWYSDGSASITITELDANNNALLTHTNGLLHQGQRDNYPNTFWTKDIPMMGTLNSNTRKLKITLYAHTSPTITEDFVDFDNIQLILSTVPTVTTSAVTIFDATSATMGGDVAANGGATATERGFVYSLASNNTNPQIGGAGVTKVAYSSGGTGSFSQSVGSLAAGTLYYVNAYATNSVGTSYGTVTSFTTMVVANPVISVSGVTAGGLSAAITAAGGDLATVTSLTVTGTIDARDFKTMRDNMPLLATLNLSGATIAAHTGTDGTVSANVTYPANEIPQYAFYNTAISTVNTSLTSISLPSSVTSIGNNAFLGCSSFVGSLTIPSTLTTIGNNAFLNSGVLFTVDGANPNYSSEDDVLFNKDKTILIQCPISKTGSYTIPSSVTSIGESAFYNCYYITDLLTIPSSVTSIGKGAFTNCIGLTGSVTIPASVTSIGSYAFYGCSNISSINAHATTPCSGLSLNVFAGMPTNISLHVPPGTKALYEAADQWKAFMPNIVDDLATAPAATTNAATSVTSTGAMLNASLNANNASTTVMFEYGLTTGYGNTVTADQIIGTTATAVSYALTDLTPNTTYHYRVVGVNTEGTTNGQDHTFTTLVVTPTITAISPTSGSIAGGTSVVITGTNFTGATAVNFGSANATSFEVNSDTRIIAVSPAGSTGAANVTVTTAGGTSATSAADQFTYVSAPTANTNAATSITSTGATLNGSVNANNASTAVTFQYGLTTSYGTIVTADQSPVTGSTATQVSKAITGLTAGTTYHYRVVGVNAGGTTNGTDLIFTTVATVPTESFYDQITLPFAPTDDVDMSSSTLAPTMYLASVSTSKSYPSKGYKVTLPKSGTITLSASSNEIATNQFAFLVSTSYDASSKKYMAAGNGTTTTLTPGAYYIVLFTDNKYGKFRVNITFKALPNITSISPTSGSTLGGTTVTITGTNFTGATAVKFGTMAATSYTVNSDTQITAAAPAGTGTVDVRVTTADGTSATSSADRFTYVATPTITAISPTSGSTAGSTSVVITGTNLTGATAVNFGSANATSFEVNSDTRIIAVSPAGSTGAANVTVTTAGGTSATSAADQFTYVSAPTANTNAATSITSTGATLNGSVNANNASTAVTFQYGLTTSYGTTVTAVQSPVTGGTATPVSKAITGLAAGTTYHYRVVGVNAEGITNGDDQSFTTQSPPQTISFGALDTKTYGDAPYDLTATSTSGLAISYSSDNTAVARVSGSTVTIVGAGTANITASQAGNTTYAAAANVIQQLTINKKALSVTAITDTKTYDGTTVSTAIPTVGTLATGDAINGAPTQVFDNANVGTTHVLTASGLTIKRVVRDNAPALDKTKYKIRIPNEDVTSNYDISYITATGTINKKAVTVTAVADTKTYDGSTASAVVPTVGTLASGDEINVAPAQAFDNAAVGTAHVLTASGLTIKNGSADVTGNYDISYATATGTINKKEVTVTALADTKTYDGTTVSTAIPAVGTLATGDAINVAPAQVFDNATVGTTHVLTASGLTIKNGSADVTGNYDISYTTATGTINKLGVTVTAVADTKTYDGTTVSAAIPTVGTLATGDAINVAPMQVFDIAAVGTTHVLTASGLTIKNGSADVTGNYDISYTTATGTINKLGVTVTAVADTKTYDGTTVSAAIPTVGTLATGDAINVAPMQVFDIAAVGTTHVLTASGLTIKNGSADVTGNYDISYTTATGTINKLGVTVTAVADTKTYDGTTVSAAIPTVGTLATGDAINVAPMQVFDIAAVGTTHVLTASGLTIKNGSADVTGNYDISYASATGSITAKALTITIPAVTLSKVHDGNTLAAVTAGTLSGVVAGDAGKVTVAAQASYDNATVGANKTITVTYTLGGSSAGNYSAPANYIATGAEIYSATIALQPLSDPTPNPTNTGLVLSYSVVTGGPTQYQITFETRAVSVGFQNVSYTALVTTGADGSISITVPKGTRPGKYKGTLKMRNDSGVESTAYDFVITVNIPTEYIAVKYNRVLVLDNSTRIFKAYQWFKNGVAIEGATKQFYRDPKGLVGTYSMQATDIDGEIIYSFPKELNIPIAQKVTAYPSLVRANQTCTVEITDESMELDLKGAELSVYSSQGIRVYHTTNVEKLNTVKLPAMDGTYSGRVTTTDGQSFLFKVIVAN